ncbi:hypothetical protein [Microbispora sp. NPDC049125]|uniref:hypothetical protein n=1 Tax=Microbispora sp. NPDC049125 TaxID=3154929 RepID=UPI00346524DC
MPDKVVYRSARPQVVSAYQAAFAALEEWAKQTEEVLARRGLSGRMVYYTNSDNRLVGVGHNDGDDIPDGWRFDHKRGCLVPRLTSAEGKRIAAELAELRKPDPREAAPGMPKNILASGQFMTCGMDLMEGAVYAWWPDSIPVEQVDLTLWEPVKLSEYYALVERVGEVQ